MNKNDDLKNGQNATTLSRRDFSDAKCGGVGGRLRTRQCCGGGIALSSTSAPRPNIVFLMGDGVRPDEVGGGNKLIQTPNIDRIGRRAPASATVSPSMHCARQAVPPC